MPWIANPKAIARPLRLENAFQTAPKSTFLPKKGRQRYRHNPCSALPWNHITFMFVPSGNHSHKHTGEDSFPLKLDTQKKDIQKIWLSIGSYSCWSPISDLNFFRHPRVLTGHRPFFGRVCPSWSSADVCPWSMIAPPSLDPSLPLWWPTGKTSDKATPRNWSYTKKMRKCFGLANLGTKGGSELSCFFFARSL